MFCIYCFDWSEFWFQFYVSMNLIQIKGRIDFNLFAFRVWKFCIVHKFAFGWYRRSIFIHIIMIMLILSYIFCIRKELWVVNVEAHRQRTQGSNDYAWAGKSLFYFGQHTCFSSKINNFSVKVWYKFHRER